MIKLSTTKKNKRISKAELAVYEMSISCYVGRKVSKKVGKFFYKDFTDKLIKMYEK